MEMKNLNRKIKWREMVQNIIAPGLFIALGLALGLALSVLKIPI